MNAIRGFSGIGLFIAFWLFLPCILMAQNNSVKISAPEEAAVDSIEVLVGRSRTVEVAWLVKQVSVAAPGIADVQVLTPRQILIVGKSVGVTDLVVWGEKAEEIWRAQLVVKIDRVHLEANLKLLFPDCRLDVIQTEDVYIIKGVLQRADQIETLHRFLTVSKVQYIDDTTLPGAQQVEIKVRMAEANRNAIRALGLDVSVLGERFVGSSVIGAVGTPTLRAYFPRAENLDLLLKALAENEYLRILAEPTLVALSGEEASFLAGGEFPVPVPQGGADAQGGVRITIEFKEFGVRLRFRPVVLGDNVIRLSIAPEVSTLSDVGAVEVSGFRIPSLLTRRADTTLELKSGQTFAMAGLLNAKDVGKVSRLPVLGELPVLGSLFRSVRYEQGETELLVLVTAHLVEPLSSLASDIPVPGDTHVPPNDQELFFEGRLEASPPEVEEASWVMPATGDIEIVLEQDHGPIWVGYGSLGIVPSEPIEEPDPQPLPMLLGASGHNDLDGEAFSPEPLGAKENAASRSASQSSRMAISADGAYPDGHEGW